MNSIPHPSSYLQPEWTTIIRDSAAEAEQQGRLQTAQLELIYQQQWFKALVPLQYNGLEWSLPEMIKMEEAISWADGSMGWVFTLCSGAGWFGGFLAPSFAGKIFSDRAVCLAGSGAASGVAEIVPEGYKVSGQWLHATGAPDATVFTANCLIHENGQQVFNELNEPLVLTFAFLRDEVSMVPTWHSIGLKATASHAFEVKNLIVPAEHCFKIDVSGLHINTPLYRFPFLQLAEATLAANLSGMAVHFVDLCHVLFNEKKGKDNLFYIELPQVYMALSQVNYNLAVARQQLHEATALAWEDCIANDTIDTALLQQISTNARALAKVARQSVDELYPYCGLTAANPDTEINRVWRDLHTASQHTLLALNK